MATSKKINGKFQSAKLVKDLIAKRTKDGLSTRAAADAAGVTPASFNRIEFGADPSFDNLSNICNWLNVPVQNYF